MEIVKGFLEVVKQICMLFQLHYNIINICFDASSD
jgi:hypothetical protein